MPLAMRALPREFRSRVERLWFIGVDTARLRQVLIGRARLAAVRAFDAAAVSANARVLAFAAIDCGVRAIVAVSSRLSVRFLFRRFCAGAARSIPGAVCWRSRALAAAVRAHELRAYTDFVRRCAEVFSEETNIMPTSKKNGAGAVRRAVGLTRDIGRSIDTLLGADEAARRCRNYVADHDAPADDAAAFARQCMVIFAQGLGFGAIDSRREHFIEAFGGFEPDRVAAFDEERIGHILQAPIIRNEAKVRACVENARRWTAAAADATYLGKVAQIAVEDDAASGWPELVQQLQKHFARIGETAARQTLKRWGFFTAFVHPGSRRVLERLDLVAQSDTPAAVQCFVGSVARVAGRDPYDLEATLALFASLGPCKREPECDSCVLAEKCPTAIKRAPFAGKISERA